MINVQVTKKIIQIRMESNRERGIGIHVCLGRGSGPWDLIIVLLLTELT